MSLQLVNFSALLQSAQAAAAVSDFVTARQLAETVFVDETFSASVRSSAGVILMTCAFRGSHHETLMQHLPMALSLSDAAQDAASGFELVRIGSMVCSEAEQFGDALRLARDADLRSAGDPARQILAAVAHAACFQGMGDPWQARRVLEPALVQARQLGQSAALLRVLMMLSSVLIAMHQVLDASGEHQEADAVIAMARDYAREAVPMAIVLKDDWLGVVVQGHLAESEFHLHHIDAAAEVAERALIHAESLHVKLVTWRLRCLMVELHLARGDVAQAHTRVERMLSALQTHDRRHLRQRVHQVAYLTYVALGDQARALRQLELCVALERGRTAEQLRSQAQELVSRVEVENALRQAERASGEAREHRRRADALADVALKDPLTGVLNRRGLDERLSALRRQPSVLVAAMVDFDFFKGVNDTYGHGVGDQVLARLGEMFRDHLRPCDAVARYGGEEFVLLLAGLTLSEASEVCERLRGKVEALDWQDTAPGLHLTVSIGLAEFLLPTQDGEADISALIDRADTALYRAKSAGRNRVEVQH